MAKDFLFLAVCTYFNVLKRLTMTDTNDDRLWRIARKRADFRKSFYSYIAVNLFLWLLWWGTEGYKTGFNKYPWAAWVTLGWGFAIAIQYYDAYHSSHKDLAEEEFQKLKRKQQNI